MKIDDLRSAHDALYKYDQSKRYLKSFDRHEVVGVTVRRPKEPGEGTALAPDRCGTGSLTSMGYPETLKNHMTNALHEYLKAQVTTARAELDALGVEVSDD